MGKGHKASLSAALDNFGLPPEPREPQTNTQAEPQAKVQTSSQAVPQTFPQTSTAPNAIAVADDPAEHLRARIAQGGTRSRLEDKRRRQTFWLSEEEISMVGELASATGADKYEVVGAAVRLLYRQVLQGK